MLASFQTWLSETFTQFATPLGVFGLLAQVTFMSRFVTQWYVSEKRKRSTVPVIFWYLSLAGGGMLFIYAAIRNDAVIMAGQGLGCMIYIRNLMLIWKRHSQITGKRQARSAEQMLVVEDAITDEEEPVVED